MRRRIRPRAASVTRGRGIGHAGVAADAHHHPGRLLRHDPDPALLRQAGGPRCHDLDGPPAGHRSPGRSPAGHRGLGTDPGADNHRRTAAGAPAQASADQPTRPLPACRRGGLHGAGRDALLEPAARGAEHRHGGVHLGAHPRRHAWNPAAGRLAAGRSVAVRRRSHPAGQAAGHPWLWPYRAGGRRTWPRLRAGRGDLGERGVAPARACRRLGAGCQPIRLVRGERHRQPAPAAGGCDQAHGHGRRSRTA